MALAANAVLDVIAPPQPRRAPADANDNDAGFGDALARTAPQQEPQRPVRKDESNSNERQEEARPTEASGETKTGEHPSDAGEQTAQAPPVAETADQARGHRQPQFLLQLIAAQAQASAATQTATAEAPAQASTTQTDANAIASQAQGAQPATPTKPTRPQRHSRQHAPAAKSLTPSANPPANATPTQKTSPAQDANAAAAQPQTQTQTQVPAAPATAENVMPLIAAPVAVPAPDAQTQKPATQQTASIDANAPSLAPDPKLRGATASKADGVPAPGQRASTPEAREPVKSAAKSIERSASAAAPAQTSSSPNAAAPAQAPIAPSTPETPRASTESALQGALRASPAAAQVGHEIVRRFNGESTRFEMRLDPPELGRIEVKLEVTRDHRVTAVVSADNPQALSDLSRSTRDLQQALQSAGLELADNGLSFDLNNQRGGFADAQADQRGAAPRAQTLAASDEPQTIAARPVQLESWRGARIDLMA